jgi:hypothetical protein
VLSEKRNPFSGLLKNKGSKEERKTKVGLDAIDKSTTLESNKSLTPKKVDMMFLSQMPWVYETLRTFVWFTLRTVSDTHMGALPCSKKRPCALAIHCSKFLGQVHTADVAVIAPAIC